MPVYEDRKSDGDGANGGNGTMSPGEMSRRIRDLDRRTVGKELVRSWLNELQAELKADIRGAREEARADTLRVEIKVDDVATKQRAQDDRRKAFRWQIVLMGFAVITQIAVAVAFIVLGLK